MGETESAAGFTEPPSVSHLLEPPIKPTLSSGHVCHLSRIRGQNVRNAVHDCAPDRGLMSSIEVALHIDIALVVKQQS